MASPLSWPHAEALAFGNSSQARCWILFPGCLGVESRALSAALAQTQVGKPAARWFRCGWSEPAGQSGPMGKTALWSLTVTRVPSASITCQLPPPHTYPAGNTGSQQEDMSGSPISSYSVMLSEFPCVKRWPVKWSRGGSPYGLG